MIFKRYPRIFTSVLCLALFTLGFFREQFSERDRVQTLVESSAQAEKDFAALVAAYEIRLNTVHSLMSQAVKHKVIVPSSLTLVLQSLDEKPSFDDADELRTYQTQQSTLSTGARDLIAAMDGDLPAGDNDFLGLYREFQGEEANLQRIEASYAQETRRVRALARKGDRQFLSPGMRLPASVKESM